MDLTITFGWWLVPFGVTMVALAWGFWADSPDTYILNAHYEREVVWFMIWAPPIIVSLVAWLVWAVLT